MPKTDKGMNIKTPSTKGFTGNLTGVNNLHPVVNPTKSKGFEGLSGNKPMTKGKK